MPDFCFGMLLERNVYFKRYNIVPLISHSVNSQIYVCAFAHECSS